MCNKCPCCGSGLDSSLTSHYPASVHQLETLGINQIRICMDCGLRFADPLPSQAALDDFYSSGIYWDDLAPPTAMQAMHAYSQAVERCVWIASKINLPPQKIADIGAGQGWMGLAIGNVWRVNGLSYDFLEPDDIAAAAIQRYAKETVRHRLGTLPSEPIYDLIFMNQVLEHASVPVSFLTSIKAGLKPGGYLYIEIPNGDDLFKANVFPHVLFMDDVVLARLCAYVDMEVVALESFGCMPAKGSLPSILLRAMFSVASRLRLRQLSIRLDKKLWKYSPESDGIWLRALVRKPLETKSDLV